MYGGLTSSGKDKSTLNTGILPSWYLNEYSKSLSILSNSCSIASGVKLLSITSLYVAFNTGSFELLQ